MFEFIKKFFTKAETKVEETVAPYKVEAEAVVAKAKAVVAEIEAEAVKVETEVKAAVKKVRKPRKPKAE
jgi:hypothetical protein